ncbi:hypothetical protein Q8A67_020580 [Cirrhinus molitorella]|uniref:Uncharacterized protein n=1 Tax=Cirrhinus molitorella TaxID=172907 RepID=A0AA88TE44_9TELE|nr:hypothetical protein Q8A67_020580 [Cirrhinus molitorella]
MHGEAPRRHKVDVCKEQWTSMDDPGTHTQRSSQDVETRLRLDLDKGDHIRDNPRSLWSVSQVVLLSADKEHVRVIRTLEAVRSESVRSKSLA